MKNLCDGITTKDTKLNPEVASRIFQECVEKSYDDGYSDGFQKGLSEAINILQEMLRKSYAKIKFEISEDIAVLEFSTRTYNCLSRRGIETISSLIDLCKNESEIYNTRNLGKVGVDEIFKKLADAGYVIDKPKCNFY